MKKIFTSIIALVLIFSLAACTGGVATPTSEKTEPSISKTETPIAQTGAPVEETASILPTDLPIYKIGLAYPQFTDTLGGQMKKAMEYLATKFNIEFVFIETGVGNDSLAAIESALQSELDGLIMVTVTPAILDAAKKAGNVPVVMIQSEPTNEDVAKELAAYDNFLGSVCENDYQVGWKALEALYGAGSRNFAIAGLTKGLSKTHDQRAQAAIDFIASKSDAKLLADDYSMGLWPDAVTAFSASFPEMDGLFVTGGMESVYQVMRTEGLTGTVKYATIDIQASTGDYFQSGDLAWIAGGQYGTTMVGFALLYNYLADGTRIIPETTKTFYRPFLELNNYDEFTTYVKYVDGDIPVYTVEEIAGMIHKFNPDANLASIQTMSDAYSIQDIQTRHAGLIK